MSRKLDSHISINVKKAMIHHIDNVSLMVKTLKSLGEIFSSNSLRLIIEALGLSVSVLQNSELVLENSKLNLS